jgi:TetR/AcrR family transcriptional repressor of nem operon
MLCCKHDRPDGRVVSGKRNVEARERIVSAAHKLFYKNGFRGTSMEDVALRAGIKKPNLFHYYPTKEVLALAVFDHAAAGMKARVAAQFDGEDDPIRCVACMFDDAGRRLRRSGCSGGCFFGNIAQEVSDQSEALRTRLAEYLRYWADQLAAVLERARRAGYFRPGFRADVTAEAILSLFEGALLYSKASRSARAVESAKQMATGYLEARRA